MNLSIITINLNNAAGLQSTMDSVFSQTYQDFEYIVIDGASQDESLSIINEYATNKPKSTNIDFKWISEPDSGIYNAMNKGIKLSRGKYLQFINSGDCLINPNVLQRVFDSQYDSDIIVGNLLKQKNGKIITDHGLAGKDITFYDLYIGTINHSSAFIKRELFNKYGYYSENYKVVSDWEFYVKAVGLGNASVNYVDVDIALFDMTGISNQDESWYLNERKPALKELVPPRILADYDRFYFDQQMLKIINDTYLTRLSLKAIYKIAKIFYKSHA